MKTVSGCIPRHAHVSLRSYADPVDHLNQSAHQITRWRQRRYQNTESKNPNPLLGANRQRRSIGFVNVDAPTRRNATVNQRKGGTQRPNVVVPVSVVVVVELDGWSGSVRVARSRDG
ncbi:MAG TPA: hypothetical protein VGT98_13340, partial [Candidatus Elarobacter sp.]|nr:hypothetical protein [Candidatus Elarobacter sp.]